MTIDRAGTEMGTFYYLAEDAFIGGDLRQGWAWERDVLYEVERHLPRSGPCNIIDVGAHVGTHTIPYARWIRRRGRVYAFEPQAVMADLLARNVDANGCSAEVIVFPFAVGHLDGVEVSMESFIRDGPNAGQRYHYEDSQPFNYGGLQLGVGGPKVVMRTLDSFAFANVGLLKVDAEGSEPLVLWGARDIIRRERPIILFEQNEKTVTDSMAAMIDIPEAVRTFRVEELASALGYSAPVRIGSDQVLLLPSSG